MIIIRDEIKLDTQGIGGPQESFYEDVKKQTYEFMTTQPVPQDKWVENCANCHIPMSPLVFNFAAKMEPILGSERGIVEDENLWPISYRVWLQNPQVPQQGEFWFCRGCGGVWIITQGFWVKVRINGMDSLSSDIVTDTQEWLKEKKRMAENELPDPGEKPSADSTLCSEHHVWRNVKPYEPTPGEFTGKMIHICPKCGCGEIKEPVTDSEEQGGN